MTGFEEFCRRVDGLAAGSGAPLRIHRDGEILRILGEGASPLARARSGLGDVAELAQATAEHHPYWELLSAASDVASAVLERWDGELTADDAAEIRWAAGRIAAAAGRLDSGG